MNMIRKGIGLLILLMLPQFKCNADSLDEIFNKRIAELQTQGETLKRGNISHQSEYQLVYFFSHDCGYCTSFSPILRRFSKTNKITLRAYSVSGQGSATFPKPLSVSEKLILHFYGAQPITYPRLFMIKKDGLYSSNIQITDGSVDYYTLTNLWEMAHKPEYMRVFK